MEYGLVAVWVIVFAALAIVGFPIAARLFATLPGRGAGFSIPISLVIMTLVSFWIGHIRFGPVAYFVGVAALVAVAAIAYRGGIRVSRPLVIEGRAIAGSTIVFSLAFLFFVAIRAVDPGITPQYEEFINFGYLNAVLRADQLPPEDIWFANESLNYYYGGHLIAAILTQLTGTTPAYAYNLALAAFYAFLASAAFEFAGAIATVRGHSRELAGGVAVIITCFAGNLLAIIQAILWALPSFLSEPLTDGIAPSLAGPAAQQLQDGLSAFYYWNHSRVIPLTLNEFPLTVWLNGQLHAYMTSTPFLLLAAGLLYSYYRTPENAVRRRRALVFGALPIIGGVVAIVDLWTVPTILGLMWLTLTFAPSRPWTLAPDRVTSFIDTSTELRKEISRTGFAFVSAIFVGIGCVIVASPFLFELEGQGTSIELLRPILRGNLVALFVVHGGFLLVFVAYLRTSARIHERGRRSFLAVFILTGLVAVLFRAEAVALFAPLLLVGWYALRVGDDVGFETVLLVAGTGLVLIIEFVYVNDPSFFGGRQNTVDKIYMQTWVLWSIAIGVMLPVIIRGQSSSWSLTRRQVIGGIFAVLIVSSASLYGGVATYKHFSNPGIESYEEPTDPTLDGLAFAEANYPKESASIHWLDNISGRPTIVSAPGGPYAWIAPAATYTGIPTIAGWRHAAQYHGRDAFRERVDDVATIYAGTPADRVALLEVYSVEYVYLGPTERERYDVRGFTELDGVEVAYENDAVTIYRVDQSHLGYTGNFTAESRTYAASDLEVGEAGMLSNGHITAQRNATGVVWRGPRTALPAGNYTAAFAVNASRLANGSTDNATRAPSAGNTTDQVARLAVTADAGTEVMANATLSETRAWTQVVLPFELDRARSNIEFVGRTTTLRGTIAIENVRLGVENNTENAARLDGDSG